MNLIDDCSARRKLSALGELSQLDDLCFLITLLHFAFMFAQLRYWERKIIQFFLR